MSRTKLLMTILMLCLALSLVFLIVDYIRVQKVNHMLFSQIQTTDQALRVLPTPAANLSQLLEQAKTDNQSAKLSVSGKRTDITGIINLLLRTADKYHLQVNPISSEQWSETNIGSDSYRMLPIDLIITGSQADFLNFLTDLENKQLFPSLFIEDVSITPNNPADQTREAGITIKLGLKMAIRKDIAG